MTDKTSVNVAELARDFLVEVDKLLRRDEQHIVIRGTNDWVKIGWDHPFIWAELNLFNELIKIYPDLKRVEDQ